MKENYTVVEDTKDPLVFKVTSGVSQGQEVKWTVKEGSNKQNPNWFYLGSELPDAKVGEVALKDDKLVDTTFLAEPVDVVTLTYKAKEASTTLDRPSEEVIPGIDPLGCSVTSTIPSNKRAKWTVKAGTALPGWSFVGNTLTPEAIKSAVASGKNLADMTFEVELVDDSKGNGDDKDKTDGKGGPDGKDKTDGRGGTSGNANSESGNADASNKLGNGSNKGTSKGSLIGKVGQSRKGTQKGAKLGNWRLSGTGDDTPSAPLGSVWLGLIMSATAIMFRRAKEEEGRTN